jgi:hypothetical protein
VSRPGRRVAEPALLLYEYSPMRIALVVALIHGLVPALGEVAEAVVHYTVEGHLAHSEADQGDLGDLGHDEHGCGATQHHCTCCPSQDFATRATFAGPAPAAPRAGAVIEPLALVALHDPAPPRRPPIPA